MKQLLLIVAFIFYFSFNGFSQSQTIQYYNDHWHLCSKGEAYYYREIQPGNKSNEPFSVKDFFISGKLQWEGHLLSMNPDIKEGWCTWFFENGLVAQQGFYEKGILTGQFTSYFKNGNIKTKIQYHNGLANGEAFTYYPNGKTIHSIVTYLNGKREGMELENYRNNQVYFTQFNKNDTLDGQRITYYDNGRIQSKSFYKKGKVQGEVISYCKTGQLYSKQFYDTGSFTGEIISYYKNGTIRKKGFYKNGVEHGDQIYYYKSGGVQSITKYRLDTVVKIERYFENGLKQWEEIFFKNNDHLFKEWDDKGNLTKETYKKGNNYQSYYEIHYGPKGIISKKMYDDTLRLHPAKDNKLCLYGLKNHQKKWVVKPQYTFILYYGQYYIVSLNEKYGVINSDGKLIIPVEYDKIEGAVRSYTYGGYYGSGIGFFKVLKDTLWGLANNQNKLILPIIYSEIGNLENERFLLKLNGLFGFVDTLGNVFEPKFKHLNHFNNKGYATFSNDYPQKDLHIKFGAINKKGEIIIQPLYYNILNNSYGGNFDLIWVGNKKKYGLYDLDGNKLLDTFFTKRANVLFHESNMPEFSRSDSLCIVCKDGKHGMINTFGKFILPCEYDSIKWINPDYRNANSLAIAFIKKVNKWAAINKKGQIISNWYDEMEAIIDYIGNDEDYAYAINFLVKKNNRYGILNANDSLIIPYWYEMAFINKQYKAVFLISSKLLYVFKNEQLVKYYDVVNAIEVEDEIFKFSNDEENYNNIYRYGLVNHLGEVLLMPEYSIQIYGDQYIVYSNAKGQTGILNRKGETIIDGGDYESIENITGDFVSIVKSSGKVGILDLKNKKFVVDTIFDAITNYDNQYGICWVKTDLPVIDKSWFGDNRFNFRKGGWGLIDKNRKYILPSEYDYPIVFGDSVGIVYKNDLAGVVGVNGKWLLPCIYQDIRLQKNGLYFIKNKKWGIADKSGNILIEPIWDEMGDLVGGQSPFWIDGNIGLVDSTGKISVAAQKDGFSKSRFPIENLFFYLSERDGDSRALFEDGGLHEISILKLISNNELVSKYFKTYPNNSLQTAMNNFLISLLLKDYAFGNITYEGLNSRGGDVNYIYSKAYNRLSYFFNDRATVSDYSTEVIAVTKHTIFCLEKMEKRSENLSFGGYAKLNNYWFSKSNDVINVELKTLFDSSKNYKEIFNEILFNKATSLQDVNLPCYDMGKYFEIVEHSFMITDSCIDFYISNEELTNFNLDNAVKLSIPFSDLKVIIDNNGVLKDFVR